MCTDVVQPFTDGELIQLILASGSRRPDTSLLKKRISREALHRGNAAGASALESTEKAGVTSESAATQAAPSFIFPVEADNAEEEEEEGAMHTGVTTRGKKRKTGKDKKEERKGNRLSTNFAGIFSKPMNEDMLRVARDGARHLEMSNESKILSVLSGVSPLQAAWHVQVCRSIIC